MNDEISIILEDKLLNAGASLVGFADISEIDPSIRNEMNYGISIGVAMTPSIVRNISNGATPEYYAEYIQLNALLEKLASISRGVLEGFGYLAVEQTITTYTQNGAYRTALPHKTIATRAGIGWIGKSALLVTEEFGSALRLSSVLTNAPLKVGTPINDSTCYECNNCTSACFATAIKGINWNVNKDRDVFFDAISCRKIARERASKIGLDGAFCGKCIEVCPYSQTYIMKY